MRTFVYGLVISSSALVPHPSAAILTNTYSGTVTYGTDTTGVFGTANTDLADKSFKVVETFDTTKTRLVGSDGATFSYQTGGAIYGAKAAGTTATISIEGSAARSTVNAWRAPG